MKMPEEIKEKIALINKSKHDVDAWAVCLNGKSAIIPYGKYRGRWGRIMHARFRERKIKALVCPYNLKTKDGTELFYSSSSDARTYWGLNSFIDTVTDKPVSELLGGTK